VVSEIPPGIDPHDYRRLLQTGAAVAALVTDEQYDDAGHLSGHNLLAMTAVQAVVSVLKSYVEAHEEGNWPALQALLVDQLQTLTAQAADDNGWPLPPPPEADQ
jgi:hypothetical protein